MSERPDTWMPMYWGDYLKDTGHLGTLEHGAYLLLIGHYWSTGAALPDNDNALANIARLPLAKWKAMRGTICRFFAVGDGAWRHGRLEREMTAAVERKAKAKDRAEHAAAKRWAGHKQSSGDAPSIARGVPEQCPSPSPSPAKAKALGSRLPDDWTPTAEDRAFAEQLGLNPHSIAPSFRDYWHGVAGAKGRKVDWSATWRNWCRKTAESGPRKAPQSFAQQAQAAAATVADTNGEGQWRARLSKYRPGGFWPNTWGPRPGEAGCWVPSGILAEYQQQVAA